MSQSSYPSPVSARPSPQLRSRVGQLDDFRDPADASRSLRQVSASLDAVYRSIRQVTRSLAELHDYSLLPQRLPEVAIGPSHGAILLTEGTESTQSQPQPQPQELMEPDYDSAFDLAASWSSAVVQPPLSPVAAPTLPSLRTSMASTISLNSPVSPLRNSFPMRRSFLETRRGESDDPTTTIGRDVAARQANQTALNDLSSERRSMALAEQSLRELDRLRQEYSRRLGVPELPSVAESQATEPVLEYPRPSAAERLARRSLDANVLQAYSIPPPPITTATPGSLMPPRISGGGRRWSRLVRGDTRQSNIQSPSSTRSDSSRLSVLSNFSIHNMATPPGVLGRDRPLLFDEPASYAPHAEPGMAPAAHLMGYRDMTTIDPLMRGLADVPRVSQLPLPHYASDFMSPETLQESVRAPGLSTVNTRPARRAWARLDADGNEIPSEEEDELERVRAEHRIRANAALNALLAEQPNLLRPNSLMADGIDVLSQRPSQPRSLDMRDALSSLSGRSGVVITPVAGSYRVSPYMSDPLPMPLDKMMPSNNYRKPAQRVLVQNAPFMHDR